MERKFGTMTEEVRALVGSYMEGLKGAECERKDMVSYVKENISDKEKLTDGVISGVVKMLTTSGELVVVSRARYRKGIKTDKLSLNEKVIALLENFQKELNKVCTLNILEVSNEDIELIKKVNEISNRLENDIWGLDEEAEEKAEPAKAEPEKANKKDNKAIPV